MISLLGPLALTTSTAALLALPLTPALRELFAKQDAGPLATRKDDGRIDYFARSLRARYEPFQQRLAEYAQREANEIINSELGTLFVVGQAGAWSGPKRVDVPVLCARQTQLPDNFQCTQDFYSQSDIRSGRKNLFRAVLSASEIDLRDSTQVLRWIHAHGALLVGRDCLLFGRASADGSIVLSLGTRFERMHAPVIYTSASARELELRNESAPFSKLAQAGIGRSRRLGRIHLAPDEQHFGDLVATKGLELEHGAAVFGSVKASGDILLAERAEVDGSVVTTKRLQISRGCFVKGPLISEHEIVIGSGVQVGLPNSPTTVSAPRIHIAPGSVLHGTVWARVEGRVEA
jgi:cytoskeletal protein CcmA (bactofilin family)